MTLSPPSAPQATIELHLPGNPGIQIGPGVGKEGWDSKTNGPLRTKKKKDVLLSLPLFISHFGPYQARVLIWDSGLNMGALQTWGPNVVNHSEISPLYPSCLTDKTFFFFFFSCLFLSALLSLQQACSQFTGAGMT